MTIRTLAILLFICCATCPGASGVDDQAAQDQMQELLSWLPAGAYEQIYYTDYTRIPLLFTPDTSELYLSARADGLPFPTEMALQSECILSATTAYYLATRNKETAEALRSNILVNSEIGNYEIIGRGATIHVVLAPGFGSEISDQNGFETNGETIGGKKVYFYDLQKRNSEERQQFFAIAATESILLASTDLQLITQALRVGPKGIAPFLNTPEGECCLDISMKDAYHWSLLSYRTMLKTIDKLEKRHNQGDTEAGVSDAAQSRICGINITRYPEPESLGEQFVIAYFTDEEHAENLISLLRKQPPPRGGIRSKTEYYTEGKKAILKSTLLETPEAANARMEKLEKQREQNKRLQKQQKNN
jgi:hypothetical protein